jgi:dipeptidyl aminopeptidase/acylaminoacyl peptidase
MPPSRMLLAALITLLITPRGMPQEKAEPDYRPRVEVQHRDFAAARANFKTQIRRNGPAPAQWQDTVTPLGAVEVTYLYLHAGFDFYAENWSFVQPFRDAGYIVMLPTLRGENGQHGQFTMYFDEVSDVINAAEYLRNLPAVDPDRIFVAGYSVGGTLTMLASELYPHFRAAASISGTADLATYLKYAKGAAYNAPFDPADSQEALMRSALAWTDSLKCPIRLFYGTQETYFAIATPAMAAAAKAHGLDAEAIAVEGDHGSNADKSLALALQFFQQFR